MMHFNGLNSTALTKDTVFSKSSIIPLYKVFHGMIIFSICFENIETKERNPDSGCFNQINTFKESIFHCQLL